MPIPEVKLYKNHKSALALCNLYNSPCVVADTSNYLPRYLVGPRLTALHRRQKKYRQKLGSD